jgi:hypothetical protein
MSNELPIQIDYTSRDYDGLITDLTSLVNIRTNNAWTADDPSDLGTVLLESMAYVGDVMSYYIDRVANELSLETATRRSTLISIGKLYGYKVSGPTPATMSITFTNISASAIDIPVGTQVLATLTTGNYREVYFESTQSATQLAPDASITLLAKEGRTVNTDRPDLVSASTNKPLPVNLGLSSGAANQQVQLPDTNIIDNSVVAYVGSGVSFSPWKFVDSLLEWGPTSQVFTTTKDEDGFTTIEFGDGVNGAIPASNQVLSALYKVSVGLAGNLVANTVEEVTFIPGNINLSAVGYFSLSNLASFGGADGDDTDQIRIKVKAAVVTKRRAVTLSDYENLALLVSQVGRVKAVSSVYSSITLYVQPQNDGSITPGIASGAPTTAWTALAADVTTYLADKIPAGTTVTVTQPTYVPLYVTLDVVAPASYKNADVAKAIRSAFINPNGLFSYEKVAFGETMAYSAVISKAYAVSGVKSVVISKLNTDNSGSASTAGVALTSGQLASLPTANLIINVTGGI